MYEALKEKPAWKTLSRKKDDAVDPTKREQVRAYRDTWKKLIDDIRNNYFFQPPSEMEADRKICIPVMHELVSLVKEYQRVLAAKKAEKNLIDFRDMEQFALQILTRKENGILEYLLLHLGRPVSQEELIEHVWDASVDSFSGSIRVHMSSLRRKLRAVLGYDPILNKVGEGYQIREEANR